MFIFNTLSGKKEKLEIPEGRPLRLFVCGPTVYDDIHIGNARTYVIFDFMARYLGSQDIPLFYLQNITDVDNKIIDRAKEKNTDPRNWAKRYEREYLSVMKALNVTTVTKYARATDHIKEIAEQIQTLIKKDHVYEIPDDGYYFDIKTFKNYGELSGRTLAQAEDGLSRIDESVHKRNKGDFTVWKYPHSPFTPKTKRIAQRGYAVHDGEPIWNTPLGWGRPGWHIEDTAITEHYFGPQYDIHGAARDLMFPHHEAEIAQQESASGKKPFVKIWMHAGFLNFREGKMSKSKGMFVTAKDFLKDYPADTFRYMVFSHYYRSPMDFSDSLIAQSEAAFQNIKKIVGKLLLVAKNPQKETEVLDMEKITRDAQKEFEKAMNDDFNTPAALAALFAFINFVETKIYSLTPKEAKMAAEFIKGTLQELGFTLTMPVISKYIRGKAEKRELFRVNKQFEQSDTLRKELDALGYEIEDTPLGAFLWPKGKHHKV